MDRSSFLSSPLAVKPPRAFMINSSSPLEALRRATCVKDEYGTYLWSRKASSTLDETAVEKAEKRKPKGLGKQHYSVTCGRHHGMLDEGPKNAGPRPHSLAVPRLMQKYVLSPWLQATNAARRTIPAEAGRTQKKGRGLTQVERTGFETRHYHWKWPFPSLIFL